LDRHEEGLERPAKPLAERVLATITRHAMFAGCRRIGVGVSGGADSVCLLHVLAELAEKLDIELSILHLDHMLRGEESRRDADFVHGLGTKLGLFVHSWASDVGRMAAETGDNLEQAARRARHDFFAGFLSSGQLDRVALGHTRSDQAETVLFRFLRGSGTAGLAGIRPTTGIGFVRPLIDVERAEVEQYLRARGIPWCEDSTNQSLDFARNRIRHQLLPALTRDWNPALPETLARTAEWAQAEEAWWEREISQISNRLLVRNPRFILVRVDSLRELPLAVARRLMRRAVEIVKGDLRSIGFEHIEAILALATSSEGSGRTQIPGLDIYRSFDWLRLAPPDLDTLANRNFRLSVTVPGRVEVPGTNNVIHFDLISAEDYRYNEVCGLDWALVGGPLHLRNWRPGDQYRPVGLQSPEKIKSFFQQSRIPLWERRNWPVVVRGDEVIWAREFGPAAKYAAAAGSLSILCIREGTGVG
jgi:tRNA(Ile)-lysidine synthase